MNQTFVPQMGQEIKCCILSFSGGAQTVVIGGLEEVENKLSDVETHETDYQYFDGPNGERMKINRDSVQTLTEAIAKAQSQEGGPVIAGAEAMSQLPPAPGG